MRNFIAVTLTSAVLLFCVPNSPSPANSSLPSVSSVRFGGVSFVYDVSLTTKVETEIVKECLDGKPGDIWPEHPAFSFKDYSMARGHRDDSPHIRVFHLDKFRTALKTASDTMNRDLVGPDRHSWTSYLDEEVRALRALLKTKPQQAAVESLLARTRREKVGGIGMPFLPLWEGCQAIVAKVHYINFKGGQGVFFLTQWDNETSKITNDGLEYAFQGITDDGKHYISAEFSVTTPFLPREDDPEVMTWNQKNYLLPKSSKEYKVYTQPITDKLNALPAKDFSPNLQLLEQLMMSLEVREPLLNEK